MKQIKWKYIAKQEHTDIDNRLVVISGEKGGRSGEIGVWKETQTIMYKMNKQHECNVQASLLAQMVKNLPAIQKTQVWSLGKEDSLEKGMATHSSILAWRIPWTEEPGGL